VGAERRAGKGRVKQKEKNKCWPYHDLKGLGYAEVFASCRRKEGCAILKGEEWKKGSSEKATTRNVGTSKVTRQSEDMPGRESSVYERRVRGKKSLGKRIMILTEGGGKGGVIQSSERTLPRVQISSWKRKGYEGGKKEDWEKKRIPKSKEERLQKQPFGKEQPVEKRS